MQNLTRASEELFRRGPDERFGSLMELWQHCQNEKQHAVEHWPSPQSLRPNCQPGAVVLRLDTDREFHLNDWSFSQLCRLARVSKDTLNRLTPETASRALQETLPTEGKPLQILSAGETVRAIHGTAYTRLYNADLLTMLREFATDFQPPQEAAEGLGPPAVADDVPPWETPDSPSRSSGGTGLYCGEQDMFCFLIDPAGWTEIGGEAFAPGFFVWNSEVGSRTVGIETFWFQAVCQNHIVWDAVEVVQFSRKHTTNVHESLAEIRRTIETLVARRDARRDGFAKVIQRAMETRLGDDAEEVRKVLAQQGITRTLVKKAMEVAQQNGAFTIFSLVDALTRIGGTLLYAGERMELDQKAAQLLALAV